MRRDLAERNFAAVEAELNEERAAALGRAGRKVEARLARCIALAQRLDAQPLGPCIDESPAHELLEEYREAREDLELARWQLFVHREAIGLNDHTWVDRIFPLPPRR